MVKINGAGVHHAFADAQFRYLCLYSGTRQGANRSAVWNASVDDQFRGIGLVVS